MSEPRENGCLAGGLVVTGALSGMILGASLFASGASAGECPADQQKPNAREPVDVEEVGKTDTVIATLDVAKVCLGWR